MDYINNMYASFDKGALLEKASNMLSGIISQSDKANDFVRSSFSTLSDAVQMGSRKVLEYGPAISGALPQMPDQITKAVGGSKAVASIALAELSKTAGDITSSGIGSSIIGFCSAHPAFVAGGALILVITKNTRARNFLGSLLKLSLWDFPVTLLSVAFMPIKITLGITMVVLNNHKLISLLGGVAYLQGKA